MSPHSIDAASSQTSQQWKALLKYDLARSISPEAPLSSARMSYEQDLTDKEQSSSDLNKSVLESLPPVNSSPNALGNNGLNVPMEEVPKILMGDNAILVDREMDRLRHGRIKQIQTKWRTIAGTAMLFVVTLQVYILAQYIHAYLALSPSSWPLSKANKGSTTSPDDVMRSLSLFSACLTLVGILFAIASGIYLRTSRSRSRARWFNVMSASITSFTSLALSVLNMALIAIWHNVYTASPSSPYAQTRDVSRRCLGDWALDILWNAASQRRKIDPCQISPAQTLRAYYIAAAIRLLFFILICAIWLRCIARYHHTLDQVASSNESMIESAEMRKLLADDEKTSEDAIVKEKKKTATSYELPAYSVEEQEGKADCNDTGPAPRLNRFHWQRTEASQMYIESSDADRHTHQKDISAGGWSNGVMSQVWSLLRGNTDAPAIQPSTIGVEETRALPHESQDSRLGVGGWFCRESSGLESEASHRDDAEDDQFHHASSHTRMSSQEKRAKEGRHAVSSRLTYIDEEQDGLLQRERLRRNQHDRIAYLASMGYNTTLHRQLTTNAEEEAEHGLRSSSSAGDELPHMPELKHSRAYEAQDGIDDDDLNWRMAGFDIAMADQEYTHTARQDNLYVRTLGKLVRKMSDIKSVGSQERIDRRSRSNCQSGSV